jgi:hypothetical protein
MWDCLWNCAPWNDCISKKEPTKIFDERYIDLYITNYIKEKNYLYNDPDMEIWFQKHCGKW